MFFWFFLVFSSGLFCDSFKDTIELLREQSRGYCSVGEVFSQEDLQKFDAIDIQKRAFFNYFGNPSDLGGQLEDFLGEIGENSEELIAWTAMKLKDLMRTIIEASERDVACFHLQAFVPTSDYDVPRWHMDGLYFRCPDSYLTYKFALALKGPSTLFYPTSSASRQIVKEHYGDRELLSEIFSPSDAFSPATGEGIFFIGSDWDKSAIHSEPPIHDQRLFFSMIPCDREQLKELEAKIRKVYESLSRRGLQFYAP